MGLVNDHIRTEYILKSLERAGWTTMAKQKLEIEAFLWRVKDGVEQLAVVACGWTYKYLSSQTDNIWAKIERDFPRISRENTLFIIVGDSRISWLRGDNVIGININAGRVKGHVSKQFEDSKTAITKMCEERRNEDVARTYWLYGDMGGTRSSALLWVLISVVTLVSFAALDSSPLFNLLASGAFFGDTPDNAYRFFTYAFVHGNRIHLLGNMLALGFIGNTYIKRNGWARTLITFMLGSAFAGVASFLATPYTGINATVGASGAAFALLGGLLADSIINRKTTNWKRVAIYTILTFGMSSISIIGTVDAVCHFAGLIFGAWYTAVSLCIGKLRAFRKAEESADTIRDDNFNYSFECTNVAPIVKSAR